MCEFEQAFVLEQMDIKVQYSTKGFESKLLIIEKVL